MSCDFGGSIDLQRLANKILYYTLPTLLCLLLLLERDRKREREGEVERNPPQFFRFLGNHIFEREREGAYVWVCVLEREREREIKKLREEGNWRKMMKVMMKREKGRQE